MDFSRDVRYGCIDNSEWYFETALKAYCKIKRKSKFLLTEEDRCKIYLYAGNHIGIFMSWIIKHDFISDLYKDNISVFRVKDDRMTGTEFIMAHCERKFYGEDVSDEVFPFVHYYYKHDGYLSDYQNWIFRELGVAPFEFLSTTNQYYELEKIINQKWRYFKENKRENF